MRNGMRTAVITDPSAHTHDDVRQRVSVRDKPTASSVQGEAGCDGRKPLEMKKSEK